MASLSLHYNGTLDDLKNEVGKIKKMFSNFSIYRPSINEIENDIYPNFSKYKNYSTIYVGKINIINDQSEGYNFMLHSSEADLKFENKPLYEWKYSVILLYILAILIIILLCTIIFCYIYEIDIIYYIGKNFGLICRY